MRKKKVEIFFKVSRLLIVTNSRGSQKLIPVPVSKALELDIVKAMRAGGYSNRSDFIRDAIREKAATVGVVIPATLARGPMRVDYPSHQEEVLVVEESRHMVSAEDAALKEQEILGAGQLAAKAGAAALGMKPKAASTTGKKGGPARPAPRASSGPQSPPKPAPTSHGS